MGIKTRYVKKYLYKSRVRSALVWAVQIIVVLLLAALFSIYMCKSAVVQEGSMDPTLKAGDKVMINTAAYRFSSPQRGDIIAFRLNEDSDSSIHIKRIIGLPGETVQILDGSVYINGEKLEEHYGNEVMEEAGIAAEPVTLGVDEYFVLGDNRNNSKDSRSVDVGVVHGKDFVGRAWIRIWPFEKIGWIRHELTGQE